MDPLRDELTGSIIIGMEFSEKKFFRKNYKFLLIFLKALLFFLPALLKSSESVPKKAAFIKHFLEHVIPKLFQ